MGTIGKDGSRVALLNNYRHGTCHKIIIKKEYKKGANLPPIVYLDFANSGNSLP